MRCAQLIAVCTALLLIDRLGRRPLLIGGSAVCCLSMLAIAAADASADVSLLLAGMCTFIAAFRHASGPNHLLSLRRRPHATSHVVDIAARLTS